MRAPGQEEALSPGLEEGEEEDDDDEDHEIGFTSRSSCAGSPYMLNPNPVSIGPRIFRMRDDLRASSFTGSSAEHTQIVDGLEGREQGLFRIFAARANVSSVPQVGLRGYCLSRGPCWGKGKGKGMLMVVRRCLEPTPC